MAKQHAKPVSLDPVWQQITVEARDAIQAEPLIGGLVHSSVLHHETLERALSYRIAMKLSSDEMSAQIVREIAEEAYAAAPALSEAARADLVAIFERDPACHRLLQPLLFFKGFAGGDQVKEIKDFGGVT